MELKRRINPKYVFIAVYILFFLIYIIYGLQPAEAVHSDNVSGTIAIPEIGLVSAVTELELRGQELPTPDYIVGSYSNHNNNTLLIGHSTSVFRDLDSIKLDDTIIYNGSYYHVVDIQLLEKNAIDMSSVLSGRETDTLTIMTCAGILLNDSDATHRLIITAVRN